MENAWKSLNLTFYETKLKNQFGNFIGNTKIQCVIHCTNFSNHYNISSICKNSANLILLESHSQVE